jgi:hypothetical protein
MKAHYKIPILLIEFDENKSFSLQVTSIKEGWWYDLLTLFTIRVWQI